MKRKLSLWIDQDAERIIEQALQAYRLVSQELDVIDRLLDQIQKGVCKLNHSLLPTIVYANSVVVNKAESWKQSLIRLEQGEIGSIHTIDREGVLLEISYELADASYSLKRCGELLMKNQALEAVWNRLVSMCEG